MPTYTFRCAKCESLFDKQVPLAERTQLQNCPSCGANFSSEREPSAPLFSVRGGTPKHYA